MAHKIKIPWLPPSWLTKPPRARFATNLGLVGVAMAVCVAVAGVTGEPTCAQAQPSSCRSTCLAHYNQCRMTTLGSPSCDAHYQSCLQGCISSRR